MPLIYQDFSSKVPPEGIEMGLDKVRRYICECVADDVAFDGEQPRKRARLFESSISDICVIGSRALNACLLDANKDQGSASINYQEDHDFHFIARPKAMLRWLDFWESNKQLLAIFLKSRVNVIAVVRAHDSDDAVHCCEFELVGPKVVCNIGESSALNSPKNSSNTQILQAAMDSGIFCDVSPLGVEQIPCPRIPVLFAIETSKIWHPVQYQKHLQKLNFMHTHFESQLRWNVEEMADNVALNIYRTRIAESESSINNGIQDAHRHSYSTSEEFFDKYGKSSTGKSFDYEAIRHRVAAHGRPLNQPLQLDFKNAKLDELSYDTLPFLLKLRLVREECVSLALHGLLLQKRVSPSDWRKAYLAALESLWTTSERPWLQNFVVSHYSFLEDCDISILSHLKYIERNPG